MQGVLGAGMMAMGMPGGLGGLFGGAAASAANPMLNSVNSNILNPTRFFGGG